MPRRLNGIGPQQKFVVSAVHWKVSESCGRPERKLCESSSAKADFQPCVESVRYSSVRGTLETDACIDPRGGGTSRFQGHSGDLRIWVLVATEWHVLYVQVASATNRKKILKSHDLVRSDLNTIGGMSKLIEKYSLGPVFDHCLLLSMCQMDSLSGLTLPWSVYVQHSLLSVKRYALLLS